MARNIIVKIPVTSAGVAAFEEAGNIFDPPLAKKLKDYVYAAGGTREENEAYIGFRGALPTVEGLLRKRGLDSEPARS